MKTIKMIKSSLTSILATGAFILTVNTGFAQKTSKAVAIQSEVIRPCKIHVSEAALKDLRQRLQATKWPDQETLADQSQGAKLSNLQELVNYWGTNYDWRKTEAKLNAYPQFITNIDGVAIHFIHVRSKERNAMPLILNHGWPGSIVEFQKVIDPLSNPTAYGGKAEDAFDVIIPLYQVLVFQENQPKRDGILTELEKLGAC